MEMIANVPVLELVADSLLIIILSGNLHMTFDISNNIF